MRPRHREVWVDIRGTEDTFAIIGKVAHALRVAAVPNSEVDAFREEAHRSGSKEAVIETCERWVEVSK